MSVTLLTKPDSVSAVQGTGDRVFPQRQFDAETEKYRAVALQAAAGAAGSCPGTGCSSATIAARFSPRGGA